MSDEIFKIIFEEFKKNGVKLNDYDLSVDTFVADPLDPRNVTNHFFRGDEIPPLLDFSEHDKVFEDKIAELKKDYKTVSGLLSDYQQENESLKQRIEEIAKDRDEWIDNAVEWKRKCEMLGSRETKKPTKINLNDRIKVKLTPLGAEIYYHQYDELNKRIKGKGGTELEPRMPKIDKDGYTEFQLWHFIELYGEHIGMCKKNVIEPLYIELC